MKIDVKNYTKYLFYVVLGVCIVFIFLFNFVIYPLKYKQEIKHYANQYQVDGALVASIILSESSFESESISSKGAVGLMQLMPATAEWLCAKIDEQYDSDKLYEPEYNIKLGTYYIKYLTDKFGSLDVAIVAYNAGEGTVSTWLKNEQYTDDGKQLKYIPYTETSNYLTKVKRAINFYKDRI